MDCEAESQKEKRKKLPRFREGVCANRDCNAFATLTKFRGKYFCIDCFLRYDDEYVKTRLELMDRGEHPLARLERGQDGISPAFRAGKRKGGSQ